MQMTKTKSFTVLELTIVSVLFAIVASMGTARYFKTIEYSRSTEAITSIRNIRAALDRCYIFSNKSYEKCTLSSLDIEDPNDLQGAHFNYAITRINKQGYRIKATRNKTQGGDGASSIIYQLNEITGKYSDYGTGIYAGF